MKKLIVILLSLTLIFSFAACQAKPANTDKSSNNESGNLEGSLEDILDKIYETAELDKQFREYIETGLMLTEINEENCAYHLGKEGIEFEEAIASVPIISPSAYELDLVRVKDGADIEKIKADIKENVDPRKWVCVGIDPENVIVDSIGDVIIVILSDDHGKALHDAFLALKG